MEDPKDPVKDPNPEVPPPRQGPYIPPFDPSEPGPRFGLTREGVANVLSSNGNIVSIDGDRLGHIGHIFFDQVGGQPSWVSVAEGHPGLSGSLVPLVGARIEGGDLIVAFDKDIIEDSPQIEANDHLVLKQEQVLIEYYDPAVAELPLATVTVDPAGWDKHLAPDDVVAEAISEEDPIERADAGSDDDLR